MKRKTNLIEKTHPSNWIPDFKEAFEGVPFATHEDQKYWEMVWKELAQTSVYENPRRYEALFFLAVYSLDKTARNTFFAFQHILNAGRAGLPIPPWAFHLIENAVDAKVAGQINSLDEAFGYSGPRGKGHGKRTPQIHSHMLALRDLADCLNIYRLTVLGDSLDSACERVAAQKISSPDVSTTPYPLDAVRDRRKFKNKLDLFITIKGKLLTLYEKKTEMLGDSNPFYIAARNEILRDKETFRKKFMCKFPPTPDLS